MNPKTVLGQAVALGALLSGVALLGRPKLAIGLALSGLLWALLLNAAYARSLGTLGRTLRRARGDAAVARQLLLAYVVPIAAATTVLLLDRPGRTDVGPFSASEAQGLVAATAAMALIWLGSSHVDWYFIRPRVDGVVTAPPCRTSRTSQWKGVTRIWYIHRTVASLAAMAWAVTVALIVTLMLSRAWEGAITQIGGFAAIVPVALWLMRSEIASAGATLDNIRSPKHWLGDDLYYETDFWRLRGFVLHVAIPVTKLVPLDRDTGDLLADAQPYDEAARTLHRARIQPRRFDRCNSADACRRLNPECTFRQAKIGSGVSHILVW